MAKRKPLTPIQESAEGEHCVFYLPGCHPGSETTVLAHNTESVPNSPRKCDLRAAYACVNCHDKLDGREPWDWELFEKESRWGRAIARTHVRLMEKGLIKAAGIEQPGLPKQLPRRTG